MTRGGVRSSAVILFCCGVVTAGLFGIAAMVGPAPTPAPVGWGISGIFLTGSAIALTAVVHAYGDHVDKAERRVRHSVLWLLTGVVCVLAASALTS